MAIRIGGFAAALCASGALIGTAVSGTGAYFTDAHSGQINASTGDVKVNTGNNTLSFNNLLPGQDKTQTISYTASGTGAEDIWLVFPTTSSNGTNPSEAFTGRPDDAAGGGLGRYGHFAISSDDGAHFNSYNLSANRLNDSSADCPTNSKGWGGSSQQATDKNDYSVPYCPVPGAILLASNKTYGQGGTATLTFGFTKLLTNGRNQVGNVDNHNEDSSAAPLVKFSIVATQAGVRPDDVNNDPQS